MEQGILLGFGETVNLVDEQEGPPAVLAQAPRRPLKALRTSPTPEATTESSSKAISMLPATRRATVVFPVPGGP